MRKPQSLEDAKAIFQEERAKARGAFTTLVGSRPALAVLTLGVISFGTRIVLPPAVQQLPDLSGLSWGTFGLPPLDFGALGEGAQEATRSATENGAADFVTRFLAENPGAVPWINLGAFVLCVVLLAFNLAAAAWKWKHDPRAATIVMGTP